MRCTSSSAGTLRSMYREIGETRGNDDDDEVGPTRDRWPRRKPRPGWWCRGVCSRGCGAQSVRGAWAENISQAVILSGLQAAKDLCVVAQEVVPIQTSPADGRSVIE